MNKITLSILLLLLLGSSLMFGASRMVIRYDSPSSSLLQSFLDANADIASYKPGEYLDIVVDEGTLPQLAISHPGYRVTQTEAQLRSNLQTQDRTIPGYNNYEDVVSSLSALTTQYPELLYMESIGSTWGADYAAQGYSAYNSFNHNLWAIKLSDNAVEEEDEPSIYFFGAFHAREPIGTQVCLNLLNHLLAGYGTDQEITDMINNTQIWFVPISNPNGHKIVLDQTDLWWRKNIRDNNSNHAFDHQNYGYGIDGVDLNRNWSLGWGYMSSSDDNTEATYHGTPDSEIETQAIISFLNAHHFIAGISYHSYSELVLYPYGYVGNILAPDHVELSALASSMANTIPAQNGGNYTASPSWGLYPASGSFDDWSYGNKGIFGYTIELATEFIPPSGDIPAIVNGNLAAAKLLLNRQNHAMLKGKIIDELTSLPIEATVYIDAIDGSPVWRAPYKSDSLYGSYYRFLTPGEYTVRYFADQYQPVTRNVMITADDVSIEDVALTPVQAQSVLITVLNDFFEPLAGASVSFPSTSADTFISDESGQVSLDPFYYGYYQVKVQKEGYETLLKYININSLNVNLRITMMPVYMDDFESGMTQWTRTGSWNTTSTDQYADANSLTDRPNQNYQSNTNNYCKFNTPINLFNQTNANVQFYAKYNLALDGDYVALQLSTDNANWFTVDHYTGISEWSLKSYSLNNYLDQTVYIRFQIVTNDDNESSGIFIDNFAVYLDGDSVENNDLLLPAPSLYMAAYPNPFHSMIKLDVTAVSKSLDRVSIDVYNIKGQHVASLFNNFLTHGKQELEWNGKDHLGNTVGNGIYFVRSTAGSRVLATRKILLMK